MTPTYLSLKNSLFLIIAAKVVAHEGSINILRLSFKNIPLNNQEECFNNLLFFDWKNFVYHLFYNFKCQFSKRYFETIANSLWI
jgi:hypothetical protein